ncbi:non-ribosomal peptide synthetase [Streptomyces sp. VRA16 Mangrove soil]|uniref:non-ribosomal peptide synthetase n=1 Tax=Streptomyces sp. VRA16 Mangrove soil TaxID=2817434 RepID=UPI001A9E9C4D|nr:non-ribosomal peptide synthetase [Streptomyces sp. VRA16 Mangrove soil]MBO1334076.1 amino acid adenylation domain-containing protein [Streptomyces sp. VRA16 Mangrove soil]
MTASPVHSDDSSRFPLTEGQAGIWYGRQLDPSGLAHSYAELLDIQGPINPGLLQESVRRVVREADALRTTFGEDAEGPWQRVDADRDPDVPLVDLTAEADPSQAADAWMRARIGTPLDPAAGEVQRHAVLRLAPRRHLWFWQLHHLVSDGVGSQLLARRAAQIHDALAAGRTPPATPFGSLAALVEEDLHYRASAAFRDDRRHWADTFADLEHVPGFTAQTTAPTGVALRRTWYADRELGALLDEFTAGHGVKRSHVLIAAFVAYVSRMTGTREPVVGLPVANRHTEAAATTPGMVSNIIPLRVPVDRAGGFLGLLERVAESIGRTRPHRRYRFEDIRRDQRTRRGTARVFGPTVNVISLDAEPAFGGCPAQHRNLAPGPIEDFMLGVYTTPRQTTFTIDANAGLYSAEDLSDHRDRFDAFLRQVLVRPGLPLGEIDVLTAAERRAFLTARPLRAGADASGTLVDAFEAQAARSPAATAVRGEGEALSYAELNARANRLARLLVQHGAGPERRVAVCLPPTADLVVALLAILKSGAAYLPIDPEYPQDRIDFLLEDAEPLLLLTTSGAAPRPSRAAVVTMETDSAAVLRDLAALPADDLRPRERLTALTRDNAAYVIHTSGSTGRPKGVVVTHGNVLRLFAATRELLDPRADDVWTMAHSFSFDFSVWELWGALLHGGRLVLVPTATRRSPDRLLRLLADESVTVLSQTPSAFHQLLRALQDEPALTGRLALRHVVFGGEALDVRRLAPWYELHGDGGPSLINMYGITETTVHSSHLPLTGPGPTARGGSPIGRPLPGLALYVLDEDLRPVPPGVTGEIHVAGGQTARGYLNRPDLTAERFLPDPFGPPGSVMYRSGDLARRDARGLLHYEGRADDQVKIRGFRIEPAEIEAELRADPEVESCCVVVRRDAVGDEVLAAYAVLTDPSATDTAALRHRLARRLPAHLVPATVTAIDRIPLTRNGKLDRRALPDPVHRPRTSRATAEPTPAERTVIDAFGHALGVPATSTADDFFDLGGDSFKAVRLARRLGHGTTVLDVFQNPTPGSLALRVEELRVEQLRATHRPPDAPDGTEQRRILRRLAGDENAAVSLVCIPYGGGTAAAYHRLAAALAPGIATWSAALPGHDPTHPAEPLLALDDTAERIAAEIDGLIGGPLALYGHCAGSALAVAVAQRLERQGRRPAVLYIGAALPSTAPEQELARAENWPAKSLYEFMKALGGFDGALEESDLRTVLDVLRHDMTQGLRFQLAAEKEGHRPLATPLVLVAGDEDAATRGHETAYRNWKHYAAHVELAVIPGAGHYFVGHRPEELAAIIAGRLGTPTPHEETR